MLLLSVNIHSDGKKNSVFVCFVFWLFLFFSIDLGKISSLAPDCRDHILLFV